MNHQKISAIEVIRTFYFNEEILPKVFAKKLAGRAFEKELQKECEGTKKISKKKLLSYHMDHWGLRYYHYLNSEWEVKEVSLKECGVYPKMSGLPSKMTYGSVVDTAQEVGALLENKMNLTWENHRVLYIENIAKYVEIIAKYVPIILLEGGSIRKMDSSILKDREKFREFSYDVDDGNNRAVALALLGHTRIQAYVGKSIYKNPLLESWK